MMFTHGHALLIGVGADLPVTVRDAQALAKLLGDPARCAYPSDQIHLLTGAGADRETILTALDRFTRDIARDPDATAIVYFSGHGIQAPDFHLMPFGYQLTRLAETAIAGSLLTEKLGAIAARKLVVLLDCCHAGGQADVKDASRAPLTPAILHRLGQGSGRVLIASSRADESSIVGPSLSVFTEALLEGLVGHGAFEFDGYARILDLAMYVGRVVTNRSGHRQHPILKISSLQDNFALAYYAGGDSWPKGLEDPLRARPTPVTPATAQERHWRRVLSNRRQALMLIEERMSEHILAQDIPLQLVQNRRQTEQEIVELEQKLGMEQI